MPPLTARDRIVRPARMWSIVLTVLGVIAALYAAAVLGVYALQGRLVFPVVLLRTEPAEVGVGDMAVVTVRTRDGLDLLGWHKPPADPAKPTVLMFHGNGETLATSAPMARDLIDAGYGVYLAEYRGYGGNPGTPNEAGLYEDGRAAMDFLEARGARIVLHGYSLGSGVAVQLATERRVEAVILKAPYTSIADVGARLFPFLPVRWLTRDRFDSLAKIARVTVPLLIYHGTRDGVIPNDQFDRLFAAANQPKRLVALNDADHVNPWSMGGAAAVLGFLRDLEASRDKPVALPQR